MEKVNNMSEYMGNFRRKKLQKESKGNAKKCSIRGMNGFFDIYINELTTRKKIINLSTD